MDPISVVIFGIITVLAVVLIFYRWATQDNDYFLQRGVPALRPALIFGNSADFFTKKIGLIDFVKKLYNDFPDEK